MEPIILTKLPSSRSLSSSHFRTAFHCWKSKLREKRRVSMLVSRWGAWTLATMTLGSLSILEARRVMGGSQNRHFLIPLSGWFSLLKPVEKKLQFDLRGISTKGAVKLLLGTFYRDCAVVLSTWYTDIRLNIFYATILTSTSRTLIRLISGMNRTGVWTVATSFAQQSLQFWDEVVRSLV